MDTFVSSKYTAGQLNAMVKKLVEAAGDDGPLKLLRGELIICCARFRLTSGFMRNSASCGWKLIYDSETNEGYFEPELMEFLREGEKFLSSGETLLQRVTEGLGQRHAEAMLRNQNRIPVEWRGYDLVFTGTVWKDPEHHRLVPVLYFHDGAWSLIYRCLEQDFHSGHRVVRARK